MSRERGRGEKTERQLFAETESRDGKQERAAGEVTVKQTVANKSSTVKHWLQPNKVTVFSSDRSSYSDSSLREIPHPIFEISANMLSFSFCELNAD